LIYHDGYNDLETLKSVVSIAAANLKSLRNEFDSIVVTGLSGVIVGSPVALRLNKPLVVIRKENDDAHAGPSGHINMKKLGKRALFFDDFVSAGNTRARVRDLVEKKGARLVATYVYREQEYLPGPTGRASRNYWEQSEPGAPDAVIPF
jgi:adenine/guanine phosphoribosyltransferase-like PRPP-binding protein